ncbi:hypothetical protein TNCV_3513461 [Trichonephila clavipes]|nr:hypothetical protein TNCV_3513461 [Trichonephila clavipes]
MIDALVACGVDQDFVSLIFSIYERSSTCVLTDEGPPDTAPKRCEARMPTEWHSIQPVYRQGSSHRPGRLGTKINPGIRR